MDFELNTSNFEKLVKELSEEERKNLLNKLKDYKTDSKDDDQKFSENQKKNTTEQESYAKTIYKKNGFLYKLFILIISFFTGKNKYEVVIENEINKNKNRKYKILLIFIIFTFPLPCGTIIIDISLSFLLLAIFYILLIHFKFVKRIKPRIINFIIIANFN